MTHDEILAKYGMDAAQNRARHARTAALLRGMVANGKLAMGQRDSSGNSIGTLIGALERAANA